MNFLRGRCWYSSSCLSICACKRIAASERSASSRPLGRCAACTAGAGLGGCCASCACEARAIASSCCWRASSSRTRRSASARSWPGCFGLVTGSGERARRRSSTVPPRSRLACARTSALAGRSRVFALTSTTSSRGSALGERKAFGNLKCTPSRTACSTMDVPNAMASTRSWPAGTEGDLMCILISVGQAFHSLGFFVGIRSLFSGLRRRLQRLPVGEIHGALKEVDAAHCEPHAGAAVHAVRERRDAQDKRQAVDPHQVLAQHDAFQLFDLLLEQPSQAPVALHRALVLVVTRRGEL